jgi:hypothetical protein
MSLKTPDLVSFEGSCVDRAQCSVRWQSERIALSRKTFDLLIYLIDHREAVATKEELLSALRPKQVVEESNLSQQKLCCAKPYRDMAQARRSSKPCLDEVIDLLRRLSSHRSMAYLIQPFSMRNL